ncbi:MAG: MiaB/RimO family radical SAM methylthiotransferase [Nanobdellota archaeon]
MDSKFYVETFGCDSNKADSNKVITWIKRNGGRIVDNYNKADYIILMSCSFNKIMKGKNVERLKEFKNNKRARIILGGCMSKIFPETKKYAHQYFGPREINKIESLFNHSKKSIDNISPEFQRKNKKVIRISTGCKGKCSYCAIKKANGPVMSRSIKDIKEDIKNGIKVGFKEFLLTSEDVGSWGQDIGKNLNGLIEELVKIPEKIKIRLSTVHPKWFIENPELVSVFNNPKVENFVYLAIQSGSDRILELMRREYTSQQYINIVKKLKKKIPSIKIHCDLLVGFPSETEDDFLKSKQIIETLDFHFLQVFAYTDMENTVARNIKPKVDFNIIKKRCNILMKTFLEKNQEKDRLLINTNLDKKDIGV